MDDEDTDHDLYSLLVESTDQKFRYLYFLLNLYFVLNLILLLTGIIYLHYLLTWCLIDLCYYYLIP